MTKDGKIDYDAVAAAINPKTKVIGIQRSKGYANRPSFLISEIKEMIRFVKEINENLIVFVDNCYGEFVEELEPCHVGADLMAGSLIKNPGGGLAKTGGYLVGKAKWIEACSYRMTSPLHRQRSGGISLLAPRNVPRLLFGASRCVSKFKGSCVYSEIP
nr:methionine gamma-lyase family protein [Bacillus subtilis]WGD85121.1 methionine gamma-lyase family protein [Bacillus subtilis]